MHRKSGVVPLLMERCQWLEWEKSGPTRLPSPPPHSLQRRYSSLAQRRLPLGKEDFVIVLHFQPLLIVAESPLTSAMDKSGC